LDIKNVTTVINYEAPQSHEIYLHRVGRTARAGRSGRACTIAAEPDRKVVKAAVKAGKAQGAKIVSRTVEQGEIEAFENKLEEMEEEIEEILAEEKEERALGQVDMRLKKGENMMEHEQEIMSRPKRTWFETEADKKVAKQKGNEELNGPSASKMKKGGKLSNKDKKRLDDTRERKEGKMWKKGKGDASARPAAKPPASKPLIKGGKRPQKAKGKGKR
jgi:ATP-dependent RNA helicase DDX27